MFNFSEKLQNRPFRLLFIVLALVSAVLYDILFWKHANGFGFLLFVSICIVLFLFLIGMIKHIEQRWPLLFLIPVIILSTDVVLFNNEFVYRLPFIIFVLLILFSLLITLHKPKGHEFYFFQIPFLRRLCTPIFNYTSRMFKDLSAGSKEINKDAYKKIFVGILVAVPLVFIFGALFFAADQIFADYFNRLLNLNIEPITIWRILRTLLLWVFLSGFFYVLIDKEHELGKRNYLVERFDPTVISTVSALLNVLFLVFVFIQFKYLFGSYEYVLNNQIIFSEYARKGFFQLIWAVLLAGGLFTIVYRSFAHHGMSKFLSAMHLLFVVQTGIIAVSALKRMNLYQEAYGYTVLRLYVEWFIYFIIALLILAVINILLKWRFKTLFHTGLVIGLVALMAVASINVDYKIANKNIDRFVNHDKDLDIKYLSELSIDVLPAFSKLQSEEVKNKFSLLQIGELESFVENTGEEVLKEGSGFLDFNFGFYKALDHLTPLREFYSSSFDEFIRLNEKYNTKKTWAETQTVRHCDFGEIAQLNYPTSCLSLNVSGRSVVVTAELGYYVYDVARVSVYEFGLSESPHTQVDYYKVKDFDLRQDDIDEYDESDEAIWSDEDFYSRDSYKNSGQLFYLLKDGRIIEFMPDSLTYRYHILNFQNGEYQLNIVNE